MDPRGLVLVAIPCRRCGRLKRPEQLMYDRHNKHYCVTCAKAIDFCELCGSTMIDDNSLHGQLHYDDWCFK